MKILPLLGLGAALLAGFNTSLVQARSSEVDGVTLERHSDRKGSDYRDLETHNAKACARECSRDNRCRAFAYWTDKHRCWLKDSVPSRTDYGPSVSGVKRDYNDGGHDDYRDAPPAYPRNMDIEAHTDRTGSDYHHENLRHAADCANLCDRQRRCQAFSYNKDQQLCWLKDRVPHAKSDQASVSGVKRDGGYDRDRDRDRYDDDRRRDDY